MRVSLLCHGTSIVNARPGINVVALMVSVLINFLFSITAMPLTFLVVGSGDEIRVSLLLNRSSNWWVSLSVRCVSWMASMPISCSLISCGMCSHLSMSPDFLPFMFREAIFIFAFSPAGRGAWFCAS